MTFWYHMYGQNVGCLRVYTICGAPKNGIPQQSLSWQLCDDQKSSWKQAHVAIPSLCGVFRMRISATTTMTMTNVSAAAAGDIAIDDISFDDGTIFGRVNFLLVRRRRGIVSLSSQSLRAVKIAFSATTAIAFATTCSATSAGGIAPTVRTSWIAVSRERNSQYSTFIDFSLPSGQLLHV